MLVAALGTNHAKPFGPEMQVKQMLDRPFGPRKKIKKMIYYHVDVFSEKPLFGNGLTVVLMEVEYEDDVLLKIAQELKQFETVFVYPKKSDYYPIRVFTVQEELPFAGHPITLYVKIDVIGSLKYYTQDACS